jgi:S-adenosylmethionine synthetase
MKSVLYRREVILMRKITVTELKQVPLARQKIEIVERKGLGHPDYICDSIMNEISIALSQEYRRRFGEIVHHNIDKGLLVAGETEGRFGGGRIKRPMLLVFGDRATFKVNRDEVDVDRIAVETAKNWFRTKLRFVDPERHVKYQVEIKPGSAELTDIFRRRKPEGEFLGANDTSAAVGYAPLTPTERLVLETERYLNSSDFKKSFPESGEDIKVMALRHNDHLELTISMAFVDRFIESESDYFAKKQAILDALERFVEAKAAFNNVHIDFNTLDVKGRGLSGIYTTVTGTSAEDADSGQVGRGNRVNGIIPLNRPSSSEAAAGKNPVSHVGKIYNLLSFKIADRIHREVPGIDEAYVWLLSKIGIPIDQPAIASAQLILSDTTRMEEVSTRTRDIIDDELSKMNDFCRELAEGKVPVC